MWPSIRAGVSTSPLLARGQLPGDGPAALPSAAVPTLHGRARTSRPNLHLPQGDPGAGQPRATWFGPRPLRFFRVHQLPSRAAMGSFRLQPHHRLGVRCFFPKWLRTAPALPGPLPAQSGCDSSFVWSDLSQSVFHPCWAHWSDNVVTWPLWCQTRSSSPHSRLQLPLLGHPSRCRPWATAELLSISECQVNGGSRTRLSLASAWRCAAQTRLCSAAGFPPHAGVSLHVAAWPLVGPSLGNHDNGVTDLCTHSV